jgi:hypothetical protein
MSQGDNGGWFFGGGVLGFIAGFLLCVLVTTPSCVEDSHKALGSKNRVCFANHTCRENLKCVYTEGLEPWSGVCVQK